MPSVRHITRQAAQDDYRLSSFIVGVVQSGAFQNNDQVQHSETAVAGGGRVGSR